MRKTLLVLFAAVILTAFPGVTLACRVLTSAEYRVNRPFDAVVIATITRSEYLVLPDREAWSASAEVTRVFSGKSKLKTAEIGRSGLSETCDDGQRIAVVGETWVLYLMRDKHDWRVGASYPLSVARKIDKRFTGQP